MQIESIPLFRTMTALPGVVTEPPTKPPAWRITYCSSDDLRAYLELKASDPRPPLPDDLAVTGLPSLAAALATAAGLAQYRKRCGRGADGFYVRGG